MDESQDRMSGREIEARRYRQAAQHVRCDPWTKEPPYCAVAIRLTTQATGNLVI